MPSARMACRLDPHLGIALSHTSYAFALDIRYKSSGQEFDKSKGAQFADAEESLITAEAQAELYRKRFEAACSTVGLLKSR